MKKTLIIILSLMLVVAFTFAVGCKKAEEQPATAPVTAPAPAPAPVPADQPADPAPVKK